ncbi:hypothetical protein [Sorangium cellulosum]|uniref:Secreted protein n=1 Tax=Sorangium cellulosum TaxID=56 RepID=A0A150QI93_SORCE|nr:hypothetical protein [Sorangium cellulosum]KYF67691.1 hypothetical protein BE15_31285 [Sorangium cellulosum]
MNRRTVCLGLSSLLLTAGLGLAATVSGAPHAPPVPLMQFGNHLTLDRLGFNLLTTNRQSLTALVNNPLRTESFAPKAALRGSVFAGALRGHLPAPRGSAATTKPLKDRSGKPVEPGALHKALLDPAAREVMKDLVECALGSHQSVSWTPGAQAWGPTAEESAEVSRARQLTWRGVGAGLCPAWAAGAPDARCQELVSACLLTRNNAMGRIEDISIRGGAIATSPAELQRYPEREGAFFGNLLDPAALNPTAEKLSVGQTRPTVDVIYSKAFVCSPPDARALRAFGCDQGTWVNWMSSRLCAVPDPKGGSHHQGCVAEYVGACGARDEQLPPQVSQHVCAPEDPRQHTYPSCTAGGRAWAHPVTVFLPSAPRTGSARGCLPQPLPDARSRLLSPVVDPMPIRTRPEELRQGGGAPIAPRSPVTPADAARVRKGPQAPAR